MSIDLAGVQQWLDAYLAAWASGDPATVAPLFTPDGRYRPSPGEDGVVGTEAIIGYWTSHRDKPGTWQAHLAPLLVTGDLAIVTGTVDYANGRRFSNLWLLRFDASGRCAEFTEWWMPRPRL
jgi:uncharacterized protein (TIGR02246 family)